MPEFLYERGRLDTDAPFAELQRRSRINALALAGGQGGGLSPRRIGGTPRAAAP